jgi:hypothetical protein
VRSLKEREPRPRLAPSARHARRGRIEGRSARPAWLPVRELAVSAALLIPGCKPEEKPVPFIPNTGQIQILNGCGKSGAAEQFRNYLTDRGFDIIEFGNAGSWNYAHTLVIARTANEPVARDLAKVLDTDNLIHLSDPLALVDATVIIGKDYEELSKRWQKAKQ